MVRFVSIRGTDAIRKSPGVDLRALALNVSTDASRQRLTNACPNIYVLVNNAGDIPGGSINEVAPTVVFLASDRSS